jgi:hypothetical protein
MFLLVACDGSTSTTEPGVDGGVVAVDGGGSLDGGPADSGMATVDSGLPMVSCPRARVATPAEVLNVRPEPSTSGTPIGTLPHGYLVDVLGMVRGEAIDGVDLWFEVDSFLGRGFIFSAFAMCTEDERPADDGNYYLPFACGAAVRITQAPGGSTSHTGRLAYAYDFGVAVNTPIHAMRAGMVTLVRTDTRPGDSCYNGGGPSCGVLANYVVLQHADGATTAYKHLNDSSMTVGTPVSRGDVIGLSGSTGYSTGPHLHLELRGACPTEIYCQTVPLTFGDVGAPTGGTVTSGNCP